MDRIRLLEDAMIQNTYDNLVQSLVESKVGLAESDFSIQMLRGKLFKQEECAQRLVELVESFGIDHKAFINGSKSVSECRPASAPNMRWWWW